MPNKADSEALLRVRLECAAEDRPDVNLSSEIVYAQAVPRVAVKEIALRMERLEAKNEKSEAIQTGF